MEQDLDLGACCACGQRGETVRNLICLDVQAPVAGTGWGCFVCGLPSNGALAVVCDDCLELKRPIVQVCYGYVRHGRRALRSACTELFTHDPSKHKEE